MPALLKPSLRWGGCLALVSQMVRLLLWLDLSAPNVVRGTVRELLEGDSGLAAGVFPGLGGNGTPTISQTVQLGTS